MMFSMEEIEEIIIGMADIVRENRFLRRKLNELYKENEQQNIRIKEYYTQSQSLAGSALRAALKYKRSESK